MFKESVFTTRFSRFLLAGWLALSFCRSCAAQWSQFGHLDNWKVDASWDTDPESALNPEWSIALGQPGYSQPLVEGNRVFVVCGEESSTGDGIAINTRLVAL
ncbi:MAG: hypothetical protein AAF456_22925, partial [Planctomycetota bacterium]